MSLILDGSLGTTFNDGSNQSAAASPYTLKNRIINGDFRIDQRNAGASVTLGAGAAGYSVDRYRIENNTTGTATAQQVADAPTSFSNSLKYTVTATDTSLASTENVFIQQQVEGFNTADLSFGTASAKTITISFWVKSSLTGTFGGSVLNSSYDRLYPYSYTISTANTWEYKTVTIAGDTTGTWIGATNGVGLRLMFCLAAGADRVATAGAWTASLGFGPTGQTNLMATNGATFYITGVQLEQNTTATPFERRMYGQELANCQRYYITVGGDSANQNFSTAQAYSTTAFNGVTLSFPVKMRTTPTFSYSSLSHFYIQNNVGGGIIPTAITQGAAEGSTMCGSLNGTVSSGLSAGNAALFYAGSTSARLNFSAEL
jgi:hypothetical protein